MSKKKWYIAGLHFECQICGNCCSGPEEGVIWITKAESEKAAQFLGISYDEFRNKYLRRVGLKHTIIENMQSKDCIFLCCFEGKKGCAIYNCRPMQCRTWPFWPYNLESPDDWNAAAQKCPGINKGRLYTFDEIEKIRNM